MNPGAVLVTGAAGFVGAHVVRALLERAREVVAAVRAPDAAPRLDGLRARRVALDLDRPGRAARTLDQVRPAVVVHLAWYARPRDYGTSLANVASLLGSAALFEAAAERGLRVVGAGTCLEYAPASRALREDDPTRPASLYAACKLAALVAGRALAETRGGAFAWARLFHLHGPGEDGERLLPRIARALRAGQTFDLSAGDQVRDHLHVSDAAAALVTLAESDARGVFNVCSGRPLALRDLALQLGEVMGRPELLRFGAHPAPPPETRFLHGDNAHLRALGWEPARTDLRADLRELADAC